MHPIIAMLMEDETADNVDAETGSNENLDVQEPKAKRRKTISGSSDCSVATNELHQPPNLNPSILKSSKVINLNSIAVSSNTNSGSQSEKNMRSKNLFGAKLDEEVSVKDISSNESTNMFVPETNEFEMLNDHCPETVSSGSQGTFAPSVPVVPDSLEFVLNLKSFAENSQPVSNNSNISQEIKSQAIGQSSQIYNSQSQNLQENKSNKKMAKRNKKRIAKPHAVQSQRIFTPSKVQDFDIFEDNRRILPKEARMMIRTTPKVARISALNRSELHVQSTQQTMPSKLVSETIVSYPAAQIANPIALDRPIVAVNKDEHTKMQSNPEKLVKDRYKPKIQSTDESLGSTKSTRSSRNHRQHDQNIIILSKSSGTETESLVYASREINQRVPENAHALGSEDHESNELSEQNLCDTSTSANKKKTVIEHVDNDVISSNACIQEDDLNDKITDRLSSRRTRSRKTRNQDKNKDQRKESPGRKVSDENNFVPTVTDRESVDVEIEPSKNCHSMRTSVTENEESIETEQANEQFDRVDQAAGNRQAIEISKHKSAEADVAEKQSNQQTIHDEDDNTTATVQAMTTRSRSREAVTNRSHQINYEESPDRKTKGNRTRRKAQTKSSDLNKTVNLVSIEPRGIKVISQPTVLSKEYAQALSNETEMSPCNGELNELEFGNVDNDVRNGLEIGKSNQKPPLFTVRASIDACSLEKKGTRRMKRKLSKIEANRQKADAATSHSSIRGVCGNMVIYSTTLSPKYG